MKIMGILHPNAPKQVNFIQAVTGNGKGLEKNERQEKPKTRIGPANHPY